MKDHKDIIHIHKGKFEEFRIFKNATTVIHTTVIDTTVIVKSLWVSLRYALDVGAYR